MDVFKVLKDELVYKSEEWSGAFRYRLSRGVHVEYNKSTALTLWSIAIYLCVITIIAVPLIIVNTLDRDISKNMQIVILVAVAMIIGFIVMQLVTGAMFCYKNATLLLKLNKNKDKQVYGNYGNMFNTLIHNAKKEYKNFNTLCIDDNMQAILGVVSDKEDNGHVVSILTERFNGKNYEFYCRTNNNFKVGDVVLVAIAECEEIIDKEDRGISRYSAAKAKLFDLRTLNITNWNWRVLIENNEANK